nr:hydroxysteroid 11-beta-dehydrogenase 1-like protein isoform X2 [Anas platyrhynchos]
MAAPRAGRRARGRREPGTWPGRPSPGGRAGRREGGHVVPAPGSPRRWLTASEEGDYSILAAVLSFEASFFTTLRDMRPLGKVLCATGIIAVLLAFFWKDTFNPESLSGARVLLTGASAGIGEQMAYHYARFGAEILLTARREAVLQKVNFFSYVALATAALPTLEKNKGSLVVVSSLTGKIPTPFTTSYSATKFALDGFFSSLRHELIMQKRNVSVTLCILGLIDTDTALEKTRGKVYLTASPAAEAALAIIQAGATKVQEVFYPWWLQYTCSLWVLFPCHRNQVLQSYYNYSSP